MKLPLAHLNIFCKIVSLAIIYLSSLLSYGQTSTIASLTDLGTRYDFAYSITIQEDEKVVLAGDADGNPFILRFDTTGVLDPTFGSMGKVFASWTCSSNPADNDIKIQSDGKIVLGTRYYNGSDDDFIVARYNTDGSPDVSFGNQGQVITKIGNYNDWCNCVIIQSDDKILAGGAMNNSSNSDYNYDFALVRYNSDGSLDTGFGIEGKVTTHIGLSNNMAYSMAIQQNGKIILAGEANDSIFSDFALARYNPDGTLDTSFGEAGIVRTALSPWYDYARSVVVQADQKILVAGSAQSDLSNSNFALLRYQPDGLLDSTFGTNGIVITDVGNDYGNSLTLQSDHKIILAGSTAAGTIYDFATLRYNKDGSPDSSFGTNGLIRTSFGNGDSEGMAAAARSNGEIIIAGILNHGSPHYFDIALLRLFSYLTSIPTSPALYSPPNGAADQLTKPTLIWNAVTEASNYNLQVSPTEEFESYIVNETGLTSTSYMVNGLSNNTSYFWRVSANNGDISTWSDIWFFSTLTITNIIEVGAGSLRLYPIPVSEILKIDGLEDQRAIVSIFTIEGKFIKRLAGMGIKEIDVSDIQKGIYVLRVSISEKNYTKQIIIE